MRLSFFLGSLSVFLQHRCGNRADLKVTRVQASFLGHAGKFFSLIIFNNSIIWIHITFLNLIGNRILDHHVRIWTH